MLSRRITVQGGAGGDGRVAFIKEKYRPFGGPVGGDGGQGGAVYLRAAVAQRGLGSLGGAREVTGQNGEAGGPNGQRGRSGEPLVLEVPIGTVVWQRQGGVKGEWRRVGQLLGAGETVCVARGGQGGRGNRRFASATIRAPFLAEEGASGENVEVWVEVRQAVDVAVVGAANSGKSTFLRRATRAKPRVEGFPFTTVEPIVGAVDWRWRVVTVMEVPGLLRDAEGEKGMGARFLSQLEDATVLLYLLDGRVGNLLRQYHGLEAVVGEYGGELIGRHRVVAVNMVDDAAVRRSIEGERRDVEQAVGGVVHCMATASGEGVAAVVEAVCALASRGAVGAHLRKDPPEVPRVVQEVAPEVVREGGGFAVRCWSAERVANVVDLDSWAVRMQFHRYLLGLGVIRALERAGVSAGDVVRIGKVELEWQ